MTIPPAKWRSQMRLEIPPALWESHLRSEDRRCVLKSHLRYENRTCEVEIADAFWNPAAALWESHLRSDGRRCVLKTHLRPSLRRCDSHNNAAAERSGTLTSAERYRHIKSVTWLVELLNIFASAAVAISGSRWPSTAKYGAPMLKYIHIFSLVLSAWNNEQSRNNEDPIKPIRESWEKKRIPQKMAETKTRSKTEAPD